MGRQPQLCASNCLGTAAFMAGHIVGKGYLRISAQGLSFNGGRVTCASLIGLVLDSVKLINTPVGVCVCVCTYVHMCEYTYTLLLFLFHLMSLSLFTRAGA